MAQRQDVALEMFLTLMTLHQQAFEVLNDDVVAKHVASAASRLLTRFGIDTRAQPTNPTGDTAHRAELAPACSLGDKKIDNAA